MRQHLTRSEGEGLEEIELGHNSQRNAIFDDWKELKSCFSNSAELVP
jgi:hypothetical protein